MQDTEPGSAGTPKLTPGTLYLVATPIGNREDITLRAVRVLRECDVVAAEDTRHSGRLLEHLGIRKPMISYFKFNEARRSAEIVERLRNGARVALVTDAGTPGISDPGQRVVAAVIAAGLRVESVPGPCALTSALAASGLPTGEFHFAGFLPVKSGQRARRLGELLALYWKDNPQAPLTAQFSLGFGVAAMLRFGVLDPTCYDPANFADPELRRLESLVEFVRDDELSADIEAVVSADVNPALAAHGGFVTYVGHDNEGTAFLTMGGGCHGCSMSRMTMLEGVQTMILEKVPGVERIRDLTDHTTGENPFYH